MGKKETGGGRGAAGILFGAAILLAGATAVFYAAYKVSFVSVDYGIHIGIAKELDWSDPVRMFREHPEPVWHLLVRAAMKAGGFSAERAAGAASGGLCALTYLLAAFFLYRSGRAPGAVSGGGGSGIVRADRPGSPVPASDAVLTGGGSGNVRADRSGGPAPDIDAAPAGGGVLSVAGAALLSLVLNLSAAIYVPWFNSKPYLGQGSPNPWHNPTTLAVRPIGLLIFLIVMGECVRVQRGGFRKGQGLRLWKGLLIAALLVLSNISKPSFVQVFYPAIFLLMFLWLFVYRCRNFPLGMQLLVCCLPSVALMGMQFVTAFYGKTNSDSAGVVIAPFKVAGLYTKNIAVSTLLVLAFPLIASLCTIARRAFDWTDLFAWLMLLCGMAEKFLLAEGGSRMAHGNFSWGYILGVYFVWFVAVRDLARWLADLRGAAAPPAGSSPEGFGGTRYGGADTEAPEAAGADPGAGRGAAAPEAAGRGGGSRILSAAAFSVCGIVLLAHLLSGIYYLYYLIVLGNGI